MALKPIIASYSGGAKIKQYLTEDMLGIIDEIARAPKQRAAISQDVLAELQAMHVLQEHDGQITLQTSVFLQEDIERIVSTVTPIGKEFAHHVREHGKAFQEARPEIVNFLGVVLGIGQGLSRILKEQGVVVDWKAYSGKYAQSKVDFDELCEAYEALGPDVQNKTVLQGERYTAVFIGPLHTEPKSFRTLLRVPDMSDRSLQYVSSLNRYLVDAYAMLLTGEIRNRFLLASAETANLFQDGEPQTSVITNETIQPYLDAIHALTDLATSYFVEKIPLFHELLRETTAGQQGAPPENMMLNLWRYIRKVTAKALYANGFLTDTIPEDGKLTIFYENNVALLKQLLL